MTSYPSHKKNTSLFEKYRVYIKKKKSYSQSLNTTKNYIQYLHIVLLAILTRQILWKFLIQITSKNDFIKVKFIGYTFIHIY